MPEWWRSAVFYEIYVRSFADGSGDGLGDLPGIRSRLRYVRDLGVDAIWLTPFYPSPGADHGYDVSGYVDVDPRFGTLADFDELVRDAHDLGLRVIVDIVPNHTSNDHRWFHNALSSPDHPDRARYVFRPGRAGGPPNNWPSVFGGPAWTFDEASGEYYLHLFAAEQPDLDWHNPVVQADFERILRFWLDRGVDGFRIDVAQALFKDPQLRDEPEPFPTSPVGGDWRTSVDQPEIHPLYRGWRRLVDSYPGERMLVGEIVFADPTRLAPYVRKDELHLAFNFTLLFQRWDADALRQAIDRSYAALAAAGATPTWVLENHDVSRLPTRYGGLRAARAGALLLLALRGPVLLYAGQELGLEDADVPDEQRQDPIFFRTNGVRKGRDGSRVPIPWDGEPPGFGFTTGAPWLRIPESWVTATVAAQRGESRSTLSLYREALALRRGSDALRTGSFAWLETPPGSLVFAREAAGDTVVCVVNVDAPIFELPEGELLLASSAEREQLPAQSAAWVRVHS